MRVLASADLHGQQSVYEWLLRTARDCRADVVVLAGDLFGCLDGFDTPEAAQGHEAHRAVILDLETMEHQIVQG